MEQENIIAIFLYICLVVAIIGLSIGRGIFVDESVAARALENQGFSEVNIVEKHWFFVGFRGCDSGDAAQFVVRCKNPANKEVEVFVCSGWPFKGSTIRTK